ncbi:hypothetical protein JHN63_15690 [Streptomyces sp. MBT65]|uniref:hypothetical protein n=1 Tax=Streptomyces sp. MBT65 TaxID=1488395 RepID=UPI00190E1579|nr:hypothetical protein [Streptomyces sp. MBT65]MBK3575229.1 hypothetical protein [Streptomyces sp. MBT65]
MEQRIGSSSQPLEGAGFDPAFVPGLTAPAGSSDTPEDAKAEAAEPEESSAEKADVDEAEAEKAVVEDDDAEEADEEASEGPVFEASDRRAEIVADAKGVRLRLDDQACEFRWDEIGAVETETPRFGKRFTITVHTPDRRWYPIEIEAAARSRFGEWETQLDAVLDAYFEDGDEDEDDESAEVDEAALAEAEAEVRKD